MRRDPDWKKGAVSPEEAVRHIESGANVFIHGAAATPTPLVDAMSRRRDLEGVTVTRKRHNDFVTEVDHEAEAAIIEVLRKAYPDHAILAEESGADGSSEYQWVIDPLDGTTNFIHGFPQYCVSIALQHRGATQHGVIYDPAKNELFTASRGRGAPSLRIAASATSTPRNESPFSRNAGATPYRAMRRPATAGPTMRAPLTMVEFRAMAFERSSLPAISTMNDCRVGMSRVKARP